MEDSEKADAKRGAESESTEPELFLSITKSTAKGMNSNWTNGVCNNHVLERYPGLAHPKAFIPT